jgi:hypothetical protein
MSERIAAFMLVVFLMLAINSYLAAHTLGIFKISHWKFGPTEIRLVLCIGNIYLLFHPFTHLFHRVYLLFDVGGVVSIAGMSLMLVVSSVQNTYSLYKLERLPSARS